MPLIHLPQINAVTQRRGISIAFWRITESEEELAEILTDYPNEVNEARSRFTATKRRCEWLAARILLHLSFGPDCTIAYLPTGRPIVTDNNGAPLSTTISISHTNGIVTLAYGAIPFGIDIERHSPRALRLVERYLTPEERETLLTDTGEEAERKAVDLWCAKEAAYKRYDTPGSEYKHFTLSLKRGIFRATPTFDAPPSRIDIIRGKDFSFALCR